MINVEYLMNLYEETLETAIAIDKNAQKALSDEKPEAYQLFGDASAKYADAAEVLLCVMENGPVDNEEEFKMNIDRLIEISAKLKKIAAKDSPHKKEAAEGKRAVKNAHEDEDEVEFLPEANLPDVHFEDIAGLADAKQLVREKIINPVIYESLYKEFGMKNRGGLLLYGPSGVGKTMLARAIAAESGFAFFHVRCSDIVGKYFGEAEKHVRALFKAARNAGNAVIFLDEAESLACKRGGRSTVMARVVPELLTQIDGYEEFDGHLIVVFATNRPFDIDPAFLRPGRMSALCYVPLPDYEVRLQLLRSQLDSRPCDENIDIESLALKTEKFSCADLVNLVDTCAQFPINRAIEHQKNNETEYSERITEEDIEKALSKLGPSVDAEELKRLEKWTAAKLPGQVA